MSIFTGKRVARDNSKLINEPGTYKMRITALEMVTPEKSNAVFGDKIQQLKVTGTNSDGKIMSMFLNQCAFAQWADLSEKMKQSGKYSQKEYEGTTYAIDKATGKRLVLPPTHAKSQAVGDILDGFAKNCGLDEYEIADFKDKEIMFVVKEENGRLKVTSTRPVAGKATASVAETTDDDDEFNS